MIKRKLTIVFLLSYVLIACNLGDKKLEEALEKLESTPIILPYDELICWTSDSIREIAPWKHASLKLVHYVDSTECTTCYLAKLEYFDDFFKLEHESNNKFYNLFIVNPGTRKISWRSLKDHHAHNETPPTLFLDSMCVFIKKNPNIPKEGVLHTFLLDENNSVIFAGDPQFNDAVHKKHISIIKEKLSKLE